YMDEKFRPSMDGITEFMDAKGGVWADFFDNTVLARQAPEHTRLRAAIAPSFTPRNINRYRELMRKVISELLDEWAPKGAFDFTEFAANFPVRVIFGLIGADPKVLPRIRGYLETQGMSANLVKSMVPDLNEAIEKLNQFVRELVAERRKSGGGE